jgi:hypothetical protein
MKTIEQTDLMMHVEQIVRPVRALDRRKLRMRRELLAHLQAALDEEREQTHDEAAAWENAKRRLGVPAELTASLQKSVPWVERLFLARVPAPAWMNRWEKYTGRQMGMFGMTIGQQGLFSLGTVVLVYGSMIVLGLRTVGQYRAAMTQFLSEQPWQFQVGNIVGGILLLLIQGTGYAITGAAAQQKSFACEMRRALLFFVLIVVWQINLVTMIARQNVQVADVMWGGSIGVLAALGLLWIGRITGHVGRPYKPWLELEIAG